MYHTRRSKSLKKNVKNLETSEIVQLAFTFCVAFLGPENGAHFGATFGNSCHKKKHTASQKSRLHLASQRCCVVEPMVIPNRIVSQGSQIWCTLYNAHKQFNCLRSIICLTMCRRAAHQQTHAVIWANNQTQHLQGRAPILNGRPKRAPSNESLEVANVTYAGHHSEYAWKP